MDATGKTLQQMKDDAEKFYKDAFCAESAEVMPSVNGYKIEGVIKIITKDRGTFYIGSLNKQ